MPGRSSWNGKWSGDKKRLALLRELDAAEAAGLDGRTWSYRWPDGWRAEVTARTHREEEPFKRSEGFLGYEWMIESILRYNQIYADHERPK